MLLFVWFLCCFCRLERFVVSLRVFSLNSAGDKAFLSQRSDFPHFDNAKVRHIHCGSRILHKKFFIFFCDFFFIPEYLDKKLLQCCSVAVLLKLFPYPKNTSIFIYKYRVNFLLSYNLFWNCNTATLQHKKCGKNLVI